MDEEKKARKERRHEVRKILLNNLVLRDDKRLAAGGNARVTLWGAGEGTAETVLMGVTHKAYPFETTYSNNRQAVHQVSEAMKDIGRGLYLETAADAAACLVKNFFFRPVVLIFEEAREEEASGETGSAKKAEAGLVLNAYCGRALNARLSIRHALSALEKALPKQVKRIRPEKEESKEDKSSEGGQK